MIPKTASDVRAFLQHRADERPRSEVPVVQIDGAKASFRLFDPIDSWGEWWGMSAKEFAQAIDDLPASVTEIELLINSPGGDAFDGLAMVNVLRAHRARKVAVVQGIAASAASFIACAADETIMAPDSTMMIHKSWGLCVGNADDMIAQAELLEHVDGHQVSIYTAKSGKPEDEIRALMAAETFFTAAQAVEAGLADSIASPPAGDTSASASADVRVAAKLAALLGAEIPSAGEREEPTTDTAGEPASVDPEQASRLLATLTLNKENTHE